LGDRYVRILALAALFGLMAGVGPASAQLQSAPQAFREGRFGLKIGVVNGIGADLTLGSQFGLELTTIFIVHTLKARVYLSESSPAAYLSCGVLAAHCRPDNGLSMLAPAVGFGVEGSHEHWFLQGEASVTTAGFLLTPLPILPSVSVGYRF
jgi:hypothetical protein